MLTYGGGNRAVVACPRALLGELAEPTGRGCAVRQLFGGVAVADFVQRERAAGRDLVGVLDRGRVVTIQLGEGEGRLQIMLGVGAGATSGAIQTDPVANTGQDVLQVASSRGVIKHFGAGHQRDACLPRPGTEPAFARHVFGLSVSGEHRIEAVVERLA